MRKKGPKKVYLAVKDTRQPMQHVHKKSSQNEVSDRKSDKTRNDINL